MPITIKRVYEAPDADDGIRILVDRLWPRGVTKEHAALDEWDKDLAPSPALRTWWDHDLDRLEDFAAKYREELDARPEAQPIIERIAGQLRDGATVTLVYAAKDPQVNHARVLAEYLAARATNA